jgi:hypothetical protein
MFGYVIPNKKELKVREVEEYRGWYCGLCHRLQKGYGLRGRVSLNYDMTFLSLLLSSLYDGSFTKSTSACPLHPVHKHLCFDGRYVEYAAAMNILLTYYKCMDDWRDEHHLFKAGYGLTLRQHVKKTAARYPTQAQAIATCLGQLQEAEEQKEQHPDIVSGMFGRLCGAIFACEQDVWHDDLWQLGFFLGKYIYLLDAWDDLEDDQKKNRYNPFLYLVKEPLSGQGLRQTLEAEVFEILTGMMGEACRYFERLPIVEYGGILRNILYSGVWTRFYQISGEKKAGVTKI